MMVIADTWPGGAFLAQAQPTPPGAAAYLEEVSRQFRSGAFESMSLSWLMAASGLVLIVVAGASIWRWWRTRHERSSPLLAFHQVASACGLTLGERVLLWRIARQQDLPGPLTLLLSPATLSHHARAYAAACTPFARTAVRRRVAHLRRRVFAA